MRSFAMGLGVIAGAAITLTAIGSLYPARRLCGRIPT